MEWKNIGPVTMLDLFGKIVNSYPSIEEAIRKNGVKFTRALANRELEHLVHQKNIRFVVSAFDREIFWGSSFEKANNRSRQDYSFGRMNGTRFVLVDEFGYIIPIGVLECYASSYSEKKKNFGWFDYDPDTDFRNGPLRGRSRIRGYHGNGSSQKQKRGYHASLKADEMIDIDPDLEEFKDMIKIRKTPDGFDPWDDERCTRRGNNWKHYRKVQWK